MSSVDVGDAVELTFTTAPGADVTVSWYDPDMAPAYLDQPATETPASSGKFPVTFLPDVPGTWTAEFRAAGAATAVERYYLRANSLSGPAPLAVLGDVADQFGSMTPAQETLAGVLLRAASAMMRARFPALDGQIAAGQLNPEVVALAVTNMVLRVLRNPSGLRAETVGPFSRTYDTTVAAGLLVISPAEEQMVTPPAILAAAYAIGTIRLKPGMCPPWGNRHGRW